MALLMALINQPMILFGDSTQNKVEKSMIKTLLFVFYFKSNLQKVKSPGKSISLFASSFALTTILIMFLKASRRMKVTILGEKQKKGKKIGPWDAFTMLIIQRDYINSPMQQSRLVACPFY